MIIGIDTNRGTIYLETDSLVLLENTKSILTQGVEFFLDEDVFESLKVLMGLDPKMMGEFPVKEPKKKVKKTKKKK